MLRLNRAASQAAVAAGVVLPRMSPGFGLLGHTVEMLNPHLPFCQVEGSDCASISAGCPGCPAGRRSAMTGYIPAAHTTIAPISAPRAFRRPHD